MSYSQQLAASGGVAGYTFALAVGSTLPVGLTMDGAGLISGTPTVGVTSHTFDVTVTDTAPFNVDRFTGEKLEMLNPNTKTETFTITILAPSAAHVHVGGRVTNSEGRGISRARVSLVNSTSGEIRYVATNQFGYYRFTDVPSGAVYVLSVRAKRYHFSEPTQVVSATGDILDIDFVALPSIQEFI